MHYAFDLDGTLIDTRAAILAAYESIGVYPPPNFFGKTFREWYQGDSPHTVHAKKNEAYRGFLHLARPLPLLDLYKKLYCPPILTGASQYAATMVLRHFNIEPSVLHCKLSVPEKIAIMRVYNEGIMFEDDLEAAEQMRKDTRWTICHTS